MYKKTITWHDFASLPHTEDFYFHMMVPEFADMNFDPMWGPGGLSAYMKNTSIYDDGRAVHMLFKYLVVNSYGRRSADGTKFSKSKEFTEDFFSSNAWEQMFLWLTDDDNGHKNAAEFWKGIFPEAMMGQVEAAEKAVAANQASPVKLSYEELQAAYEKALVGQKTAANVV